MYALRILTRQPVRCVLTVAGIALCVLLMLFLLAVYRAVSTGSVEYVRSSNADLWVLQRSATNILRGSSMLSTPHGIVLRQTEGVATASPVLLILSVAMCREAGATLFLAGYDVSTGMGGPPKIVAGRGVENDDEIVLDRSFAAKWNIAPGDAIRIQDDSLTVVGLSGGTNAFVVQYGFSTIRRVQRILGHPGLVTCYLVTVKPGADPAVVRNAIMEDLPGVEVFDRRTFLANNIQEMESGFLPILYAIAAIGGVVLTSILTLLLTVIILESRRDFAVMRALGAPDGILRRVICSQALMLSAAGTITAALFFPSFAAAVEWLTPEVSTQASFVQTSAVTAVVFAITVLSAWIAIRRLRGIYPLEAFA
ncbi:MAG: ABC transporter permease [Bacteroidota bacterium]